MLRLDTLKKHTFDKPCLSRKPLAKTKAESISCSKLLLLGPFLFLLKTLYTLLASLQHLPLHKHFFLPIGHEK